MSITQHAVLAVGAQGFAPEPVSPITGWPVWVRPVGLSPETEASLAIFTVVSTLGAAVYTSYILRTRNVSYKSHSLHYVVALYCWATFASMTLSRFISGGTSKLFVPGGGFHNMAEFVILFKFIAKDDEKHEWLAWWAASVLYVGLIVVCHALPWPLDALWFKFQGLIADTALPIAFLALWRAQHDKRIEYASATVAALLHFSGNVVVSIIGGGAIPFYYFSMTYAIAYPIYAYWVNIQTLPTAPADEESAPLTSDAALPSFRWPATTNLQAVLVFAIGVATSAGVIVAGLKFAA